MMFLELMADDSWRRVIVGGVQKNHYLVFAHVFGYSLYVIVQGIVLVFVNVQTALYVMLKLQPS